MKAAAHILVVDDDPALRELMSLWLHENKFQVTTVATSSEMTAVLQVAAIDLVLLDLFLDGDEAIQLARGLRGTRDLPVIVVGGKLAEADRPFGMEIAADDYVATPITNRDLVTRIRCVLRRYQVRSCVTPPKHDTKCCGYRFAGWELNLLARRLTSPDARRVELSNGEFNLLVALCEHPQRILSRDQLLKLSRLHGTEVYERSIDVQILRLRRKIESDEAAPKMIRTERGAGYVFELQVQVLH